MLKYIFVSFIDSKNQLPAPCKFLWGSCTLVSFGLYSLALMWAAFFHFYFGLYQSFFIYIYGRQLGISMTVFDLVLMSTCLRLAPLGEYDCNLMNHTTCIHHFQCVTITWHYIPSHFGHGISFIIIYFLGASSNESLEINWSVQ